jgi:hypothetical protein
LAVLGADFPFHFAQRCFIASEIRLRAAALIARRLWRGAVAVCDFGGRRDGDRVGRRGLPVPR